MEPIAPTDAQRLFDLISRATYNQLNQEEHSFVRAFLTESEYEELHKMTHTINPHALHQKLETKHTQRFRAELKEDLRSKVKAFQPHAKPLLLRPVPAYQLVAAALIPLLLVGIRTYFYHEKPVYINVPKVVYQDRIDTLYINKPQAFSQIEPTRAVVATTKKTQKPAEHKSLTRPDTLRQLQNVLPWPAEAPVVLAALSKNGFSSRNLEDDSLLAQFFVRVN